MLRNLRLGNRETIENKQCGVWKSLGKNRQLTSLISGCVSKDKWWDNHKEMTCRLLEIGN